MEKIDSILTSVKKMCGIDESYEHFDPDIIMHTNTVLAILTQMGVGPKEGFIIYDKTTMWTDFIPENTIFEATKTLVGLRVRLIFDPPASSIVLEALKENIKELEWRVYTESDNQRIAEEG